MPRVAATPVDPEEEKKAHRAEMIKKAAKMGSIELQADSLIRLQLPEDPPLPRCAARPFAAAIRKQFGTALRVLAYDASESDSQRQPTSFSMSPSILRTYLDWAASLGVPPEKLRLPPWLTSLAEVKEDPKDQEDQAEGPQTDEPAFFSQPAAHQLMPYQKEGIRFGINRAGRVLLADDMGLGKTVQALGIAYEYRDSWPMLVVCPSSLRNVWENQIQRWLTIEPEAVQIIFSSSTPIEPTARVVVVSYALLGKSEQLQTFHGQNYKLVISDECHYIKDPDAQRSQALLKVAGAAERVILVSGTPILNSAMELYPLLQILDPNIADREEKYVDPRREEELHAYLFGTVGIRRKKEQVLSQLPPKTRQTIKLSASSSISKLKAMEEKLFNARTEDSDWWATYRVASHSVMEAKKSCVGDYIKDVIDNGIGKFLLFAHHQEMLNSLESVLTKRIGGEGYIRIDGSTPQRQRADLVKRFQEDLQCHCGLLSITALAEGQTLTSAEAVIFAELVWTPGTIDQCEDDIIAGNYDPVVYDARAHRIGQQGSVLIQYLLLQDSEVDRRCYRRLEEKHQHAAKVLDNNSSSAFWEETVHREKGKRIAGRGLGDRAESRPKPLTAFMAHPKSRSAPSSNTVPAKAEGQAVKKTVQPKSRSRSDASSTPSSANSSVLTGECYKVVDHLHLGLNLKLGGIYSKEDLEARCKGNEQKLGRLRWFLRERKKLELVDSGSTGEPPSKKQRT